MVPEADIKPPAASRKPSPFFQAFGVVLKHLNLFQSDEAAVGSLVMIVQPFLVLSNMM
jgi:hypothetical protein